MTAVSKKIKERQERCGTTVAFIAREVRVSRMTVHTWKSGTYRPRADHLPKLAEVLGCSVDDLMD